MTQSGGRKHPRVLTCGDNCLNIIMRINEPLSRGANLEVSDVTRRPGGNALVTALALSSWGIKTAYSGVIGLDEAGQILRRWLQLTGVDFSAVVWRNLATRQSYVILDPADRTILDLREKSALAELQVQDWQENAVIEQAVRQAEVILIDKYCSAIHGYVIELVKKNRENSNSSLLLYRTGSRPSDGLVIESRIFPKADVVLTKQQFLQRIIPGKSPLAACKDLSQRFKIPVVVATSGREGVAYYDTLSATGYIIPAEPVKIATTLGAGDFFRAGFILGLLRRKSIEEACRLGNIVAAKHCELGETEDPAALFFSPGIIR